MIHKVHAYAFHWLICISELAYQRSPIKREEKIIFDNYTKINDKSTLLFRLASLSITQLSKNKKTCRKKLLPAGSSAQKYCELKYFKNCSIQYFIFYTTLFPRITLSNIVMIAITSRICMMEPIWKAKKPTAQRITSITATM